MPNLKLFNRRKSSGSALDIAPEQAGPVQSSFKVLDRPNKSSLSSDGRSAPRPPASPLQMQMARGRSTDNIRMGLGAANRSVENAKNVDAEAALKRDRGSGGTTNSGSSGYYESSSASARHSSSSTLPSSLDQEREREAEDDDHFTNHPPGSSLYNSVSALLDQSQLQPPSSFRARAAKAIAFGSPKHVRTNSVPNFAAVPESLVQSGPQSPGLSHSPQRDRSMTGSSYASTAVPTKSEPNLSLIRPVRPESNLDLGNSTFGGDFGGNMFDGIGKSSPGRSREILSIPAPPPFGTYSRPGGIGQASQFPATRQTPEPEPMFPPQSYSRQALTPPPNALRNARGSPASGSPYAARNSHESQDGLMPSSALSSPGRETRSSAPTLGSGMAPAFLGRSKGYAPVPGRTPSPGLPSPGMPSPALGTSSEGFMAGHVKAKTQAYSKVQADSDNEDEEEHWEKEAQAQDAPTSGLSSASSTHSVHTTSSSGGLQPQTTAGFARSDVISPGSEEGGSLFASESRNATPRAVRPAASNSQAASQADGSPAGPVSRVVRPEQTRTASGSGLKANRGRFESLQRSGHSSLEHVEEDPQREDRADGDEEEMDPEQAEKLAKQRRKQEANMAIYRQQMKKMVEGGVNETTVNGRPFVDRAASSLYLGGMEGTPFVETARGKDTDSDEDEDVPLGVLQAHGFPSSAGLPIRSGENDILANQRRMSMFGSVAGGNGGMSSGDLPAFARRLPADPYLSAAPAQQPYRDSMAYGGGAQSVYGGAPSVYGGAPAMTPTPPPMGLPGGLVGVIAGEERAKAARRGSPNPITGTYAALPSNMQGPMPQMPMMPRSMSMGSVVGPQVYTPSGHMMGMPPMPPMPMMSQMMPPMPQMMPSMPQMMMPPPPQQDTSQQQLQQFMQMQMQVMQNMLAMQQQQMTPQPPRQQTPDFLGVPGAAHRPLSMAGPSQAPSIYGARPAQGRSMTMLNPPPIWDANQAQPRPASAMPGSYAPSVHGLTVGPAQGYTPSIAPSERNNVGLAPRYRPVQTTPDVPAARSQSMTSSMTLQALTTNNAAAAVTPAGEATPPPTATKSTIRLIDKPKGTAKSSVRPVSAAADDDEDDGWAEMAKKRSEKKFGWRRKDKVAAPQEPTLADLYEGYE